MALTEAQRIARQNYIGSSEAAAIMGLNPYMSAADLWLTKTGRAAPFEGNEATDRGNRLEPAVLSWAEEKIGEPFDRDVMIVAADGCRAANFDGIKPGKFVVEGKTTVDDDEWGEEGTNIVPARVTIQTHHQMEIAGPDVRVAYVPMLIPTFKNFEWRMYVVDRNDELADIIAQRCRDFMEVNVRGGVPPEDYKPSIEVLKRIKRTPAKYTEIPDELVQAWLDAKAVASKAEKAKQEATRAVVAALGDCEAGTCGLGTVTYLEYSRTGYIVEPTTYRQLMLPKAGKGGGRKGSSGRNTDAEEAELKRLGL